MDHVCERGCVDYTLAANPIPRHYASLAEHIAEIEAGWTLPKPWKIADEERQEAENVREIAEMLIRWAMHGISVDADKTWTVPLPVDP